MHYTSQSRYLKPWFTFGSYLVDVSEKISDKMASEKRL